MEKSEVNRKVKEIIINTLDLEYEVDQIKDETPLFGDSEHPGLFDSSLCVLEVTSGIVAEFDIEPSIFKGDSFRTVGTLIDSVYCAIKDSE